MTERITSNLLKQHLSDEEFDTSPRHSLRLHPSPHEYRLFLTSDLCLKPQDSFGAFVTFFLDLQKVDHTIRKHHQTHRQLF